MLYSILSQTFLFFSIGISPLHIQIFKHVYFIVSFRCFIQIWGVLICISNMYYFGMYCLLGESHGFWLVDGTLQSFSICGCHGYKHFTCSGAVFMLIFQLKYFLQDSCSLNLDSTLDVVQVSVSYFFQLPCHAGWLVQFYCPCQQTAKSLPSPRFMQGALFQALALLESGFLSPFPVCVLIPIPKHISAFSSQWTICGISFALKHPMNFLVLHLLKTFLLSLAIYLRLFFFKCRISVCLEPKK